MGNWIADMTAAMGYPGVALLTLIENVFPPIPSELVRRWLVTWYHAGRWR